MPQLSTVLFDLDGTLLDPADGITRSIQYALAAFGQPFAPRDDLLTHIGPPLRQGFATLLGTSEPATIERAMALYRERFAMIGLFENQIYPGVIAMLEQLRRLPVRLFLATSKPQIYAARILAHFQLDEFFSGIYGSELDGRFDNKGELLAHLLDAERITAPTALMVGDRRHDVAAAKQHGLWSIGVTYGYGSAEELISAGADWLCATPREVAARICEHAVAVDGSAQLALGIYEERG